MAQTAFAFDAPAAPAVPLATTRRAPMPRHGSLATSADEFGAGFEIGREHARYGVVPPAQHLLPGHPVRQGWALAQPAFDGRTRRADPAVRMWLRLRLHAWQHQQAFDTLQLTPHYLRQLAVSRCPVIRRPLSLAEAHITPLAPAGGFTAGQLVALSPEAAKARGQLSLAQVQQHIGQARAAVDGLAGGLSAVEWTRLATLMSLVTPLPVAALADMPMAALPPNRVMQANPLQGLQALAMLQLAQPDWGLRVGRLVDALPNAALRRAFHLWLHRLLPRVWEGGRPTMPAQWRERLEDAALDGKVLAAWQRFASQLSAAQTEALLNQVSRLRLPGWQVLDHASVADGASPSPARHPAAAGAALH
ncbi:MAG TPA: hypothetical protein VLA61_03040 [Ideonella sp.]|uniref:hypothetical protein n=1 Tax=Ideonella sp. TaxID=1929293 RepID=UPI002CCE6993|nr:hypothetical protein [Ideonella sp.]HSI47220.1 hypothetical protein [Ideonella sp.]